MGTFSENVSQNGESWIWQMMQQYVQNKRKFKEIKDSKKTGVRYNCDYCEYKENKATPRNTHTRFS